MGSLLNAWIYSHKGIRTELAAIEEATGGLGAPTEAEVAQFADRFALFHALVKGHSAGEDAVIFPALDAKVPHCAASYSFDHQAEETIFATIDGLLDEIRGTRGEERAELTRRLGREVTALHAILGNHSRKEDALLAPLLRVHFSPPELGAVFGKSLAYMPQDLMPRALPLVIRALSADEQEDYLRTIQGGVPPPVFQKMAGWVKAGIPAAGWSELAARMPELEGAG